MSTQEFWSKEGGDAYTLRNANVDWRARTKFWRDTIPADVLSVFECGTNVGANLRAIRACRAVQVRGIELNQSAVDAARGLGLHVMQQDLMSAGLMWDRPDADLTFTCGVLIHMSPEQIGDAMEQVAALSRKYVMAVEYMDETEVMVNYRGSDDLLWRRNYGKLYEDMGLRVVRRGDAGEGFDKCGWVLCSKG